jgi:hypothetical protein
MSVTSTPVFTQAIKSAAATGAATSAWTPSGSSTTNLINVLTAGANGARVTGLIASTTDTSANDLFIVVNRAGAGGTLGIVGQVHVAASSGTIASTPSVDLLASVNTPGLPVDNNGKPFIHLQAGDVLYIGVVANMTAAKTLFIDAQYENY